MEKIRSKDQSIFIEYHPEVIKRHTKCGLILVGDRAIPAHLIIEFYPPQELDFGYLQNRYGFGVKYREGIESNRFYVGVELTAIPDPGNAKLTMTQRMFESELFKFTYVVSKETYKIIQDSYDIAIETYNSILSK